MIEVALVFDRQGEPIFWHKPASPSSSYIEDDRGLWDVLWENRDRLGGVAHTHPWNGIPLPSQTDVTTFAAIEAGLGQRLLWPIVTMDKVSYYQWRGPETHEYVRALEVDFGEGMQIDPTPKGTLSKFDVQELRRISRWGG